jgi:hypothetical protein
LDLEHSHDSPYQGHLAWEIAPISTIRRSQANLQHYFGVGAASCWFEAPASEFGVGMGEGEATPVCSRGIILDVVGVSTTPQASLMGLLLRNLVRVQKCLKPPGTWTSDVPEAASSWTT